MSELVAFYHARLDEDDAVAWRVAPNQSPVDLRAAVTRDGGQPYLIIDSARMLREVVVKRRLLSRYQAAVAARDSSGGEWYRATATVLYSQLCDEVTVYSDHPDYRQEWKP